jgi:hypothetical protein
LRKGLTEHYLPASAPVEPPKGAKFAPDEDLMAGSTMEDFLGPELTKTKKA